MGTYYLDIIDSRFFVKALTVGIISPGDMGHAVGKQLINNKVNVITALDDRSNRTKKLAKKANIKDVGSLSSLVEDSDLILSILVPSQAMSFAKKIASILQKSDKQIYFAECNAIAPQTTKDISVLFENTNATFIDSGIIGGPPSETYKPTFYTSGPDTEPMLVLEESAISVIKVGLEIGQASALKMCYAALNKGTIAINIAVLTTAKMLGVYESLITELGHSQNDVLKKMQKMNEIPTKADRWIGEMLEISNTFESAKVTGLFHKGAADIYDFVSKTGPGVNETPENYKTDRSLEELITIFANYINNKNPS